MTKKFWKDNRGQMIYAVVVAIMFLSVLSMIAMGLSLQHYHAAVQKQENIANYYKVDAAAEMIRIELMKAETEHSEESTTEEATTEAPTPEEPTPQEAAEENGDNAEEGVNGEENGAGDNEQPIEQDPESDSEQSPLLAEDIITTIQDDWDVAISNLTKTDDVYTYTVSCGNVAVTVSMENNEFTSWEVSYNASND